MNWLLVFIGGGAGSVLRYFLGIVIPRSGQGFPWPTFMANVGACIFIGLLAYTLKDRLSPQAGLLLATGFCGGLSTFSTFSLETIELVNKGQFGVAGLYIVSSLITCLLTVLLVSKMT